VRTPIHRAICLPEGLGAVSCVSIDVAGLWGPSEALSLLWCSAKNDWKSPPVC
jgi:hypothetical protein